MPPETEMEADDLDRVLQAQAQMDLKLHEKELGLRHRDARLIQRELDLHEWAKRINKASRLTAEADESGDYYGTCVLCKVRHDIGDCVQCIFGVRVISVWI